MTPVILSFVDVISWNALAAPFSASDLVWRVVKLSPDRLSAQVSPQLRAAALAARFDAVLGVGGWSQGFAALGERGLVCTLSIAGTSKAAVAPYTTETDLNGTADDALAAAAALFGLRPAVVLDELPWVDYDPEQQQPLYEPDLSGDEEGTAQSVPQPASAVRPEPAQAAASEAQSDAPPVVKSAGQQAIDKLVDRLKADGKGLGAARLLNTYGGYGSDPDAARELYAKLRELLRASAP